MSLSAQQTRKGHLAKFGSCIRNASAAIAWCCAGTSASPGARSMAQSLQFGEITPISQGEVNQRLAIDPESNAMRRGWEYSARKIRLRTLAVSAQQ